MFVNINIPYGAEITYKAYSQGWLVKKGEIDDDGAYIRLSYKEDTVFVIFYYFSDFRRAYIATSLSSDDKDKNIEGYMLPGVDQPVKLIFAAKGRKVDFLKKSIFILTQKDEYLIFRFPLSFWYKLAGLIENKGAKKSDIINLYKNYEVFNENE